MAGPILTQGHYFNNHVSGSLEKVQTKAPGLAVSERRFLFFLLVAMSAMSTRGFNGIKLFEQLWQGTT